MPLNDLLSYWRAEVETAQNFAAWRTLPARPADVRPIPADVPPDLKQMLRAGGIFELYSHQSAAWMASRRGENLILSTGTASGKTLSYNLPALAALLENPSARALYLYPTKALAQDQLSVIHNQLLALKNQAETSNAQLPTAAIYDGDTPQSERASIRKTARMVLSNPDMLHTGILPHHTVWNEFFAGLKFVVIDEAHTYRGVFGSHVANVIRRLKRVAAFYGGNPQFILASATIGNPRQHAENLIEAPATLIDQDGSARGPRHFIIYNPPVIDPALGIRKSSVMESVRLAQDLLKHNVQSVVFARARRSVEILLKYLMPWPPNSPIPGANRRWKDELQSGIIRGYRSGYLPSYRREIEHGLRDGSVRMVVATNALELGIDIGGLGAALLVGYPGAIASARQQAGRAGRGLEPAAAILVASPNPLDQFLAHHPEYFFEHSPEQALINPNHLLILLNHLRCALFELPFEDQEGFGGLSADMLAAFFQFFVENREAHQSAQKTFWMSDSYPAAAISLRTASPETVLLQTNTNPPQTIGTVDYQSALWMAHPGAIYLHEGQQYFVERLDLAQKVAALRPLESDYYTEPLKETRIEVLTISEQTGLGASQKAYGEIQATTRVTGFRKTRWHTRENLGQEPLDLPPTTLETTAYWLSITPETVEALSRDGLWTNTPNDYGPQWPTLREKVRARDAYRCQLCGRPENGRQHDVHHKIPFRMFRDESGRILRERANQPENLTTLCPECHKKAETNVRVRSGLAGLAYALANLAPLFLMCDPGDLGTHLEPVESAAFPQPSIVLYDLVPAGIGFSEKLYEMHSTLLARALELVRACECEEGCPACVGPAGENGLGGKQETLAILKMLVEKQT